MPCPCTVSPRPAHAKLAHPHRGDKWNFSLRGGRGVGVEETKTNRMIQLTPMTKSIRSRLHRIFTYTEENTQHNSEPTSLRFAFP